MFSGRMPHMQGPAAMGVNMTANDTIANVVANLEPEENDQSDQEDDDRNKRAERMDIGGPPGSNGSMHKKSKPMNYMEAQGADMNMSMERKKRQKVPLENDPERRACGSC